MSTFLCVTRSRTHFCGLFSLCSSGKSCLPAFCSTAIEITKALEIWKVLSRNLLSVLQYNSHLPYCFRISVNIANIPVSDFIFYTVDRTHHSVSSQTAVNYKEKQVSMPSSIQESQTLLLRSIGSCIGHSTYLYYYPISAIHQDYKDHSRRYSKQLNTNKLLSSARTWLISIDQHFLSSFAWSSQSP